MGFCTILFCHIYVRSGLPMVFAFVAIGHALPMHNNCMHLSWILRNCTDPLFTQSTLAIRGHGS